MNIILGISGGIAAYKSADIASGLVKRGHSVDVIMTTNAMKFITPLTLEVLTKRKVYSDMWERSRHIEVEHISLAKRVDAVLIAPASANTIAKLAHGLADDMLTTVCLAAHKKSKFIAPAMNTQMWENPIVQANLDILKTNEWKIIDPIEKILACGDCGTGALADVELIIQTVLMANEAVAI